MLQLIKEALGQNGVTPRDESPVTEVLNQVCPSSWRGACKTAVQLLFAQAGLVSTLAQKCCIKAHWGADFQAWEINGIFWFISCIFRAIFSCIVIRFYISVVELYTLLMLARFFFRNILPYEGIELALTYSVIQTLVIVFYHRGRVKAE